MTKETLAFNNVIASGSTTSRSINDRFADIVNVKDFGAKGDGVTNDREAIQTAIDKANGRTVFLPSGTYAIKRTLILNDHTHLTGDGMSSVIALTSSNDVNVM